MQHSALFVGSINPAAVAAMRGWLDAGHHIAAFWRAATPTGGPVKRDRRLSLVLPRWSVAALARQHRFPIRDVPRLGAWADAARDARTTDADVLISVYFPFLIPSAVLEVFGSRAVNFHPAPLPRYRGPTPLHAMALDRSILTDGAMTLHVLTAKLDEGPILAREPVAFPRDLSLDRYRLALAQAAKRLARDAVPRYLTGDLQASPQIASDATYVTVKNTDLDLSVQMSADEIHWRCRVFAKDRPVRITGLAGPEVAAFGGVLGPRTCESPEFGRFAFTFDAADARVRVWRKLPLTRQARRLRALLILARTPV